MSDNCARTTARGVSHRRSLQPVILSAAKDLRWAQPVILGAAKDLRWAQDDRLKLTPKGASLLYHDALPVPQSGR